MLFVSLVLACMLLLSVSSYTYGSTPAKSVWPQEFDAVFSLWDLTTVTPQMNQSSIFNYRFHNSSDAAQLITYPERCIALGYPQTENYPCQLYFIQNNVYYVAPQYAHFSNTPQFQCCLLIPDVGPVPPTFLQGFNFSDQNSQQKISAQDYFGVTHSTYYWTGHGFAYWTDQTTGHDVFFNDGSSGVFWAWNPNFNVRQQPAGIFDLPSSSCSQLCPQGPSKAALFRDPILRMSAVFGKGGKHEVPFHAELE